MNGACDACGCSYEECECVYVSRRPRYERGRGSLRRPPQLTADGLRAKYGECQTCHLPLTADGCGYCYLVSLSRCPSCGTDDGLGGIAVNGRGERVCYSCGHNPKR